MGPISRHGSLCFVIVSPDVVLHVPFPGLSPDFAGLLTQLEPAMAATNDVKIEVKAVSIDEPNRLVTHFFEATGTQTGYGTPSNMFD